MDISSPHPSPARIRAVLACMLPLGLAAACGTESSSDAGTDGSAGTAVTATATTSSGTSEAGTTAACGACSMGDGDGDGDTGAAPCSAPEVRDDFSAAELDTTKWMSLGASGIDAEIVDQRLAFVPTPGWSNTRTVLLRSVNPVDLTECTAWVEVPRVLPETVPSGEVTWSLSINGGADTALIRVRRPNIQFAVTDGGQVNESFVALDEVAQRWWRFRDEAGVLYLETSADGLSWTVGLEHPHTWDLSSAQIGFSVIVASVIDDFEAPQFDNMNVAP